MPRTSASTFTFSTLSGGENIWGLLIICVVDFLTFGWQEIRELDTRVLSEDKGGELYYYWA